MLQRGADVTEAVLELRDVPAVSHAQDVIQAAELADIEAVVHRIANNAVPLAEIMDALSSQPAQSLMSALGTDPQTTHVDYRQPTSSANVGASTS